MGLAMCLPQGVSSGMGCSMKHSTNMSSMLALTVLALTGGEMAERRRCG